MNVITVADAADKRRKQMHSVTDEKQGTSTASAVVVETGAKQETAKPKAARKQAKPAKQAKQAKPAKQAKQAKPGKQAKQAKPAKTTAAAKQGGKTSERSNKKAEVIALMQRAKGVTLAEILEATGWQKTGPVVPGAQWRTRNGLALEN
jgi:Protein of unknown function (DUF3489)